MNSILTRLLLDILRAASADAYLKAQDEALPLAARQYGELAAEAQDNPDPALRIEALELAALLEQADADDLLLACIHGDTESRVAEHAKALLYRLTVARNVRESGQMPESALAEHQARLRRRSAEARYRK